MATPPDGSGSPVGEEWIERVFGVSDEAVALRTGFTVLGRASAHAGATASPWIARMLSRELDTRAILALEAAKVVGRGTAFSLLGDVLERRLDQSGDAALASGLLAVGIPFPTVSLNRAAAWIIRTLLDAKWGRRELGDDAELETLQSDYAGCLTALGRHEEAFWAASTAIELHQGVNHKRGERGPKLAAAMRNRGGALACLRYDAQACLDFEDAARLLRDAFSADPVHAYGLMVTLTGLSIVDEKLGRAQEALNAVWEGMKLADLRVGNGVLASVLRDLTDLYSRASEGNREELFEEGFLLQGRLVAAVRLLAEVAPDELAPLHYLSVRQHATSLRQWKRLAGSRTAIVEAISIGQRLWLGAPELYTSALAHDLHFLGRQELESGDPGNALRSFEEALAVVWPRIEAPPSPNDMFDLELLQQCTDCCEALGRDPTPNMLARAAAFQSSTGNVE